MEADIGVFLPDTGVWGGTLRRIPERVVTDVYVGAREYAPTTGRFLKGDPLLDTSDAPSLNGYTYADDNPTTGSDPTGRRDCGETAWCRSPAPASAVVRPCDVAGKPAIRSSQDRACGPVGEMELHSGLDDQAEGGPGDRA
ncbi:RHS repeat-associated core domain-containing protein [Streptomyces sp. NPDC002092]